MKQNLLKAQLLATIKQKETLRKELIMRREQLTAKELFSKSQLIEQKVLGLAVLREAKNIMCYVSKDQEVATHQLIKSLLKMDKKVAVPFIVKKGMMKPALINDFSELSPAGFNTLQPKVGNFLEQKIDINLMPALAISKKADRLGWGAGFYDRFINDYRPKLNLALIFDCQLVDNVPSAAHDQKIDGVITESQYLLF